MDGGDDGRRDQEHLGNLLTWSETALRADKGIHSIFLAMVQNCDLVWVGTVAPR